LLVRASCRPHGIVSHAVFFARLVQSGSLWFRLVRDLIGLARRFDGSSEGVVGFSFAENSVEGVLLCRLPMVGGGVNECGG
jgi:hypothetical protein